MSAELDGLPKGIKSVGVPDQDKYPGERDRTIFNSDESRFVSAVNIREAPMTAYFGNLIWGQANGRNWRKTGGLRNVRVLCNGPFAKWLSDQRFVTRVHIKDGWMLYLSVDADLGFRLSEPEETLENLQSNGDAEDWVISERKLTKLLKERQKA